MDERRSAKRWRTTEYAKNRKKYAGRFFSVYNRADEQFIGHLADISSEGMMILAKRIIPEGTNMKLRIELPEEIKGSDQMMVEARTVWHQRDTNPEYFRIGFSFTFTFPHHANILSLLFEDSEEVAEEMPVDISTTAE